MKNPAPSKFNVDTFIFHLQGYPNEKERQEIVQHLHGYIFDIQGDISTVKTSYRPLTPSALKYADQNDIYFIEEMELGRITAITEQVKNGTIKEPKIYVPFSVIDYPKFRSVFDFSHSINGISLNSLVPDDRASVELITIRQVATVILYVGPECVIGKKDLKSAFRQSIKHLSQVFLSAYFWRDEILVDWYMPWGTRNAARKCHLISKAIVYITERFLPVELHGLILCYIDDFMFFGKGKKQCLFLMKVFQGVCDMLGVIVKHEKTVWPCNQAKVLGKDFYCPILWVKNNEEKLNKYKHKLLELLKVSLITQTDMRSIEGCLTNVAPFAWPLKCLLRRFRDVIPYTDNKDALIFVTEEIKDEARMWLQFIDNLNGISINELMPNFRPRIDHTVECDSGNKGCGAYNEPYWLCTPFHEFEIKSGDENNIAQRELFGVVCAFSAWAGLWYNKNILIQTDNATVFWVMVKKDSKNKLLMDMIRMLCLMAVENKFRFFVNWVKRDFNTLADALSNLDVDLFKKLCTQQGRAYTEFPMLFQRPFGQF